MQPRTADPTNRRRIYLLLATLFMLAAVFLPRDWYDALPKRDELPEPPIKGVTLFRLSLALDGLIFLCLLWRVPVFRPLAASERLPSETEAEPSRPPSWFPVLVLGLTSLALALRLYRVGSDLWLDEITPIQDYGHLSPLAVIGSFLSTNNHLLNTLLVQLSTALFGEAEWSVRLPAVLFGVATIPALYWVARQALSRWASLGAALLLAVSYHHIFFSQNARGYSAYIFFSLVSSGLLVRGLQDDRPRTWALYAVTMCLNFAAHLNSFFVLGAHVIVGAAALVVVRRNGGSPLPLLRRLLVIFAVPALLVFQLYATVLPQVYVFIHTAYVRSGSGYNLASGEFLREMARGLSAGFGPGLLVAAVPFLLLAGVGFVSLWRRRWSLAMTLVLPLVLTAGYLIVNRLTFSPRFFIFSLPLAMITVVSSIQALVDVATRVFPARERLAQRLAFALVVVVAVLSAWSLRAYYSVPKQSYRASLQYLESVRKPGEIVIVVYNAERGYRYYAERTGVKEADRYFYVRSVQALDAVLSSNHGRSSYLVITFPRSLHFFDPALEARLMEGWEITQTFPATVGDGAISVWTQSRP